VPARARFKSCAGRARDNAVFGDEGKTMERRGLRRWALHLGWLAGLLAGGAVWLAARLTPGYSHALHPVGLLGSAPLPVAEWFNLAGCVAPGVCLAGFALAAERDLVAQGHGRLLRIATGLLLISGVAFAAQGWLPFDARDLDGPDSRRHAVAHALALLAWLASTALLALALRARPAPVWAAAAAAVCALALGVLLAWPPTAWLPGWQSAPGHAQRLVLALFFLWPALLALGLLRLRSAAR
jgi:hypothetical protein